MKPNQTELEILKCLWEREPKTAREIHDELSTRFHWSYSSTRKTLERMAEKNFLRIGETGNKNIYYAQLEKLPTLAEAARDFAKDVFELDGPLPIAAMFADSRLIQADELDELENHLNELAEQTPKN